MWQHRGPYSKCDTPFNVCVCGEGEGVWKSERDRESRQAREREKRRKREINGLLDAKFICGWRRHPSELRVWHGTDDTLNEVLVAVAYVALRGQFRVGDAACQVHQILKSTGVAHAAVLDFIDWWELWDWDQFFLWSWAEIQQWKQRLLMM